MIKRWQIRQEKTQLLERHYLYSRLFEVRNHFEQGVIPSSVLEEVYKQYNPDIDTATFIQHSRRIFPLGNCGLASAYLQSKLGRGEIFQGSYAGEPHTFLILQLTDNPTELTVADITADQFGGSKIYLGDFVYPYQ